MANYRIGLDIGNKKDMDCVSLQNVETNEITTYLRLEDIEKHVRAEVVEEIRKLLEKEKEDNDLAWYCIGFKKLNRILDQVEKGRQE